ncbi:hypothetical protein [Rubellimicrobium sp. CFH 75288]|uniref:hypothetical protein n=1 Tax=Rubellimicrobium sp. CFH 75288 TaxID=2697034 RepID=UPI0014124430|nr:hypothetical protein [Rubellimicrobium sp. CFH 75288]NAZ37197.1 hypothetical protein [Rubellimicrobium sp. CFH 75288]
MDEDRTDTSRVAVEALAAMHDRHAADLRADPERVCLDPSHVAEAIAAHEKGAATLRALLAEREELRQALERLQAERDHWRAFFERARAIWYDDAGFVVENWEYGPENPHRKDECAHFYRRGWNCDECRISGFYRLFEEEWDR